ncbi:MAG: metalloregulator ArsR/SmtB family transcription factor [Firmicutes bacterium]|nr:metalloregulator ArsR/SmtB family transcription factor [Bacillota bacterium]
MVTPLQDRSTDLDYMWKALADPIRRMLLETLAQKEHFCHLDGQVVNGICVQDLSTLLQLPQSTVSRHLTILRQAGLVDHQQKGVWHYYACQPDRIRALKQWLDGLCWNHSMQDICT